MNIDDNEHSYTLSMAENAIDSGLFDEARDMANYLSDGSRFFIDAIIMLTESNVDGALQSIESCINAVRNPKSREPILEARARMIRGLARTSLGETTEGGSDLRWAMDRLSTIADGSDEHGIAILNVAAWHRQQSEIVMSLATHSEIARESSHSPEIVAVSRHRVASIHSEMGDYTSALRHHWTAWKLADECSIDAIAESSCLHVIDLGLTMVSESVERLDEQVKNAAPGPRSPTSSSIHPDDLTDAIVWITPRSLVELSGHSRPDLALIIESHKKMNLELPIELVNNKHQIEDQDVLDVLQ